MHQANTIKYLQGQADFADDNPAELFRINCQIIELGSFDSIDPLLIKGVQFLTYLCMASAEGFKEFTKASSKDLKEAYPDIRDMLPDQFQKAAEKYCRSKKFRHAVNSYFNLYEHFLALPEYAGLKISEMGYGKADT